MRKLGTSHWVILFACVCTIVLLGFANTSPSKGKQPEVAQQPQGISLEEVIKEERSLLKPDQSGVIASLEQAIKAENDVVHRGQLYDSLVKYLGRSGNYVLASFYAEQKAKQNNGSGSDWMAAGERYRSAASFQKHEDHLPPLYESAIRCFSKALELDPTNLDAKVGLGIAIVDGTTDPMKGITILREVEAADSTHINVQLALADFAVRSKQYDKAIERYKRVLTLKPEFYAIHLSLAELYEVQSDTAQVIVHLEAYANVTDDPVMKAEIEKALEAYKSPGSK
ncbi:MAG TPA: tetratricopeptide repeat protein [Bacteroidia bacterium]|nr:tetratricopeptide repeat protein [Bacteroidia bacterium]